MKKIHTTPLLLLCFVALLAGLVIAPAPAHADPQPKFINGKFAYVDMQPGNDIIRTRNGDGSNSTQLYASSSLLGSPTWAPNGRKLAFDRGTPAEIMTINSDGTGLTNISSNAARDENPAWSPDGSKIVFISDRGHATADYRLYLMNADGTNQTDISEVASEGDRFPKWSPDGTKIYYNSRRGGTEQLHVYTLQSQVTTQFTNLPNSAIEPSVSPDGSKVVFAYAGPGDTKIQLYIQNTDGTGLQKLFGLCSDEYSQWPTWSPDGRKIIFISECGTTPKSKVYMIDSDGTDAQQISDVSEDVWSTMGWHAVPVDTYDDSSEPGKIKVKVDIDLGDTDFEVHKDFELFIAGQSGNVIVHAAGVLKGSGVTGRVTVEGLGRLAPGSSPGCLASGDLTMTTGSTLDQELGGTVACSGYDRVNVTGAVSLGNATLNTLLYGGFVPSVGNTFTIIANNDADPVTGTFSGLAEGATFTVSGVEYVISYVGGDGNDVVLTVSRVIDSELAQAASSPGTPNTGIMLTRNNPLLIFGLTLFSSIGLIIAARMIKRSSTTAI